MKYYNATLSADISLTLFNPFSSTFSTTFHDKRSYMMDSPSLEIQLPSFNEESLKVNNAVRLEKQDRNKTCTEDTESKFYPNYT